MTGKRFENRLDKSNVKFNTLNPTWDNEKETGLNVFEMIDELNNLSEENEELKKLLECSRKEANDYCEELMGKDEFIRLYKRQRDEVTEENEQLKDKCYNIRENAKEYQRFVKVLKKENENLKIAIDAKETLIDVCEKKFKELGYMISCDDDGYIVEALDD